MKQYEVYHNLTEKQVTDLINSGKELISVERESKTHGSSFHFVSEVYPIPQTTTKEVKNLFDDKQLHQLLAVLGNAEFNVDKEEDERYETFVTKENRITLINYNHELQWDIADKFGYDLNEGFVDPDTLKFKSFRKNK